MSGALFDLLERKAEADRQRDSQPVERTVISFAVPGEPKTKGRPRATLRRRGSRIFADAYTPKETIEAEKLFAARCLEFAPDTPLKGPIAIDLGFVFSVPDSWPKWQREAALRGEFHHIGSKDVDNVAKLALDAMNGVFFVDDKQIVELRATKSYGAVPRTRVTLRELEQAERNGRR
jgi:Holliday junction resolvase RusA-like endonuclease